MGLSIAVLALPRGRSLGWYLLIGQFFVFFANAPDFPLPGWGHGSYQVSHSLFLTASLAASMSLLLLLPRFNARVYKRVLLAWTIAWLSHLLLDSMYSHGRGIGIFWPLSDAHLALPVPWFDTLTWPPKTPGNLRVFAIELAVYGSLLAACVWIRSRRQTRYAID